MSEMFDTNMTQKPALSVGMVPRLNGQVQGPSEISFKHMRFLIMNQPTEATLDRFIQDLNKKNVKEVVRVCDPTYDATLLQDSGIQVIDWPMFEDGQVPPRKVLEEWLALLRTRFAENPDSCVAVHCVAGLGRAPVLVAIALMELGMKSDEAVDLIRMKRRGAINQKQQEFLEHYRAKSRLRSRHDKETSCSIQ